MIRIPFYFSLVIIIWNIQYFVYSVITGTHLVWAFLDLGIAILLVYQIATYDYFSKYKIEIKQFYLNITKWFKS